MGQPGANKTENAMAIADYFQWRYISVADCLAREEAKKSEDGKRITDCFKQNKMGKQIQIICNRFLQLTTIS